ncbi:hypothetical protein FB567DRAFT_193221 [Paraphoma chrysanthemicola]|uniref:Zn(2)-C6 fungal-type domain-containing protein n=1 Tax=Paraphoma chrysanthemicola TaxID=798071 RepID=A0A8K0QXY2_9PLEO|nr:hypothetical protein FB567DRAFT_193221 [Paraphoma chrysanthemicola]
MVGEKDRFTCTFCYRGFTRGDALKRHWGTCKVRRERDIAVPEAQLKIRGRKPRACDTCSRMKRACTTDRPCRPCLQRNYECTYTLKEARSPSMAHTVMSEPSTIEPDSSSFDLDMFESVFNAMDQSSERHASSSPTSPNALTILEPHNPQNNFDLADWDITWAAYEENSLAASLSHRPTDLNIEVLIQFPFLDKFTKASGFVNSFECGSVDRRSLAALEWSGWAPCGQPSTKRKTCDDAAESWIEIAESILVQSPEPNEVDSRNIGLSLGKTHEIVSWIRNATINKPRRSIIASTWSISLETMCYEFFNPTNLQRYLALFWTGWYHNWPTIHRPSFDINSTSPSLIAAMVVVGACLSADDRDRAIAQLWFNTVEELVFDDDVFSLAEPSHVWQNPDMKNQRKYHIDVLQAAYCVCLYQTWEGSKQSRKRVLRQRFSSLVFLTRDIGLAQASLKTVDTSNLESFDWEEYITRESLIRLACYVFAIDSAFAQFYRHPPRMTVLEMTSDLASPDTCFSATTAEECFVFLKTWRSAFQPPANNLTLSGAVEALCEPQTSKTSEFRRAFEALSVLDMFTIVSALFSQVFHLELSLAKSAASVEESALSIALRQWRDLWPSANRDAELAGLTVGEAANPHPHGIGFIKHAPEYWLLTHLILERRLKQGEPIGKRLSVSYVDGEKTEIKALLPDLQTLGIS